MSSINDIEVFCTIVKAQSLSAAARELGLSSSIVTRRLARLEQHLQVRLFERTTRTLNITEVGQRYYNSVSELLLSLQVLENEIKNSREEVSGTLKVGLPVSISNRYVTKNLYKLLELYPHLKIKIVNGNHLLNLLEDGFDCVLYCGPLPDTSYYYKKISTWKKVLCASPQYLSKYGFPTKLENLKKHSCLDHLDNITNTWSF